MFDLFFVLYIFGHPVDKNGVIFLRIFSPSLSQNGTFGVEKRDSENIENVGIVGGW